jgi:hypothetical protein
VGLSQDQAGGYAPPDVQVAAGPGFVVETVNVAAEIWRPPKRLSGRFRFCVHAIGRDGNKSAETCAALRLRAS